MWLWPVVGQLLSVLRWFYAGSIFKPTFSYETFSSNISWSCSILVLMSPTNTKWYKYLWFTHSLRCSQFNYLNASSKIIFGGFVASPSPVLLLIPTLLYPLLCPLLFLWLHVHVCLLRGIYICCQYLHCSNASLYCTSEWVFVLSVKCSTVLKPPVQPAGNSRVC